MKLLRSLTLYLTVVLIISCAGGATITYYKAKPQPTSKMEKLCLFLMQDPSVTVLEIYQSFFSIEESIKFAFGDTLYELERWDQVPSQSASHVVEWKREEIVGTVWYSIPLYEGTPEQVVVLARHPISVTLSLIQSCLGQPSKYAVANYAFPFSKFDAGERTDVVFLYYEQYDIELQLLKPRSREIKDVESLLYLTEIHVYPAGQLSVRLTDRLDYPPKESIRTWK